MNKNDHQNTNREVGISIGSWHKIYSDALGMKYEKKKNSRAKKTSANGHCSGTLNEVKNTELLKNVPTSHNKGVTVWCQY